MNRSGAVTEKPIKVDEETDRVVTDLAHFLRSTKKSIVRDAVAEYAESRHALLPPRSDGGGAGERSADYKRPGERSADDRRPGDRTAGDRGSGERSADVRSADYKRPRERSASDRSAREDGAGIEGLAPMQRLGLRRKELIREFARHRGTNIRVLEASGEDDDDEITLLVDTDVMDGGGAAPRLQEIARRLLATDVTVVSMTALRLMGPEQHPRALAESHAL
jgi:predicted transcriptional regulator